MGFQHRLELVRLSRLDAMKQHVINDDFLIRDCCMNFRGSETEIPEIFNMYSLDE